MNENDELIGKSQESQAMDDDPHDGHTSSSNFSAGSSSSGGSGRRRNTSGCRNSVPSSTSSNSSLDKVSILPPYKQQKDREEVEEDEEEEDDCFGKMGFGATSAQTTITSVDSNTRRLLSMTCRNAKTALLNSKGPTSNQFTISSSCSSCTCEVCQAKRELDSQSRTFTVSRPTYNMAEFDSTFRSPEDALIRRARAVRRRNWCQMPRSPAPNALLAFFYRYIPLLDWIRSYDVKGGELNADLMAGLTIAVFQIPQCMGYSLLAGVPPIYGLYTSFLTPLIYAFLGTSKHASIGTFAIISLMTGSVIADMKAAAAVSGSSFIEGVTEIEIATTLALLIGLYHLLCFFLRLGYLAQFMSEQLTSGFICASAVYVLSSQLGYITGVKHLQSSGTGPFGLVRFYADLTSQVVAGEANLASVTISVFCIGLLIGWKFFLSPAVGRSPHRAVAMLQNLPFELLLVAAFITASWYFQLEERFHLSVLGPIPQGLPAFATPLPLERIYGEGLWRTAIPLAIVAFAVTYSTGVTFGAKHGYEVSANQELLALGATNSLCAFFQCMPSAASLSRSALAETVGTRSQIAGLVNSVVILVVLLFLSPLLCFLPKCVLASIICVALKSLFLKVVDLKKYIKLDKIDGSIWIVSFFAVIIFNVDLGLYIGLAYSLGTLIAKSQRPKTYMLGAVGGTNVYVPLKHYRSANDLGHIKVFQFCGPLHFANVNYFKSKLAEKAGLKQREKNKNYNSAHFQLPFAIVIDCSMFSYIDATGITALRTVVKFYEMRGVRVMLADVAAHVRSMMAADSDFHLDVPTWKLYITTHDAVHRAQEEVKLMMMAEEEVELENMTVTIGTAEETGRSSTSTEGESVVGGGGCDAFLTMTGNVPGGGGGGDSGGGGGIGNKVKKKSPISSLALVSVGNGFEAVSSRFTRQSGSEVLLSMDNTDEQDIEEEDVAEKEAKSDSDFTRMMMQSQFTDANCNGPQSTV